MLSFSPPMGINRTPQKSPIFSQRGKLPSGFESQTRKKENLPLKCLKRLLGTLLKKDLSRLLGYL
jgi:hypothetical protein